MTESYFRPGIDMRLYAVLVAVLVVRSLHASLIAESVGLTLDCNTLLPCITFPGVSI